MKLEPKQENTEPSTPLSLAIEQDFQNAIDKVMKESEWEDIPSDWEFIGSTDNAFYTTKIIAIDPKDFRVQRRKLKEPQKEKSNRELIIELGKQFDLAGDTTAYDTALLDIMDQKIEKVLRGNRSE